MFIPRRYVIYENKDGTEVGMTPWIEYDDNYSIHHYLTQKDIQQK